MDISWKYIDLNISSFEISKNAQIYFEEDSSLLLITNSKTTSIIHFDPATLKLKSSEIISDNVNRHNLFSNSGTIYILKSNGCLLRLLCTSNMSIDHGSVFGSSGSSASEVFSWSKVCESLGNIVNATGVSNGFAAIINNSGFYSFNVYQNVDKPIIQCSKRLQLSGESQWNMFSFKSNKLSQRFMKHIFGELSLVVTDIIVLSTPTGTVLLFPVLPDNNDEDFFPIHCDTDKLVHVAITPCKNALMLIYQNGRIIFTIFDNTIKTILYKRYYLSTAVKAVNVVWNNSQFSIIWSDGISTYYTIPNTLDNFSFSERKTNMRGIVKMEIINSKILLFNVNCSVYLAELNSNIVDVKYLDPKLKTTIMELSKNIEEIKKNCQISERNFNTLKIEDTDITQFKLSFENNNLCIENLSSSLFKKEQWIVFLESNHNFKNYTKKINLMDDLGRSCKTLLPVHHFLNLDLTALKVSLIADLFENQRLLIVSIGNFNIPSNAMEINK